MEKSLRNTVAGAAGWPSWVKTRTQNGHDHVPATIRLQLSQYLQEEFQRLGLGDDPVKVINCSQRISQQEGVQSSVDIWDRIEQEACKVIFSSNFIENAGGGWDVTVKLCTAVLRGEDFEAVETPKEFQHPGVDKPSRASDIRSRREMVQHAQALSWAIDHLVLDGQPWSEEAVKTMHRILYEGMANEDVPVPGEYRGLDHHVAVKGVNPATGKVATVKFVHPRAVATCMAEWIADLSSDIQEAEDGGACDPYDMAAHYHYRFINIHPFGDGNGRVSRLILNCIVLKFTGHLLSLGEDHAEKEEFFAISYRSTRMFHQEDGEVDKAHVRGHREMARLMARKSAKSLTDMWSWVQRHQ